MSLNSTKMFLNKNILVAYKKILREYVSDWNYILLILTVFKFSSSTLFRRQENQLDSVKQHVRVEVMHLPVSMEMMKLVLGRYR